MRIQYDHQGNPLIGGWLYLVGAIMVLAIVCIIFTSLFCTISLIQNGFGKFIRNNFFFGVILYPLIFYGLYTRLHEIEPSDKKSDHFIDIIFVIYAIFTFYALPFPFRHSFVSKYFIYKQIDYLIYWDMIQFLSSFLELTLLIFSLYLFSIKHRQFITVYLSTIIFNFISTSIIFLSSYNGLNKMSGNTDVTSLIIFGLMIHFIVISITSLYLLNSERVKTTFSDEKKQIKSKDYAEDTFSEEVKQPYDAKAIIHCPKCAQKIAVPPGRRLRITCPTCQTKFEMLP